MVQLNNLSKITKRTKKRVGRGYGSGKGGHTSGRGQKGQKSRGKVPLHFVSGAMGASMIKRLPLLRGKGKLKPNNKKPFAINIKYLNVIPAKTTVTEEVLIKHNIVVKDALTGRGVKILGGGALTVLLHVAVPVTKGAKKQIEDAGGAVVESGKLKVES
ncbi:MAG TPA: 50S ribosomal protein L15 [Patescibacteria group bacterium]|nr:50S ribosomal protein L15 [Patescibacteria group bacterium]